MTNLLNKMTDLDVLLMFALRIDMDDRYEAISRVFFAKLLTTLFFFFTATVYWYITFTKNFETVFVFQYAHFILILKI
jgi:hypothetical protein